MSSRVATLTPEVPTFKELGYNIEGNGWYALFAPARTPKDMIDRYAKDHDQDGIPPTVASDEGRRESQHSQPDQCLTVPMALDARPAPTLR